MKRINVLIAGVILFASCNSASTENKEGKKDSSSTTTQEEKFVPVDSATSMKNWQAYATPSEMHQLMASWNGTWNSESSLWMVPGMPPSVSKGKMVNKMILNGLFQEGIYTGIMMGQNFEGRSTMGYDNSKKLFINTWYDNTGSGITHYTGTWDAATKTLTLKGKSTDFNTGKDCSMREVYKVIDEKTHVMEMFGPSPIDGKEFKTMEIKFTRSK